MVPARIPTPSSRTLTRVSSASVTNPDQRRQRHGHERGDGGVTEVAGSVAPRAPARARPRPPPGRGAPTSPRTEAPKSEEPPRAAGRGVVRPAAPWLARRASGRARPALRRPGPRRRRPSRARSRRRARPARRAAACCGSRWSRPRRRARGRCAAVAVDPVAGQVDLGLDRRAVAERQHAGDRRQRVQVDAPADRRPERAGVVAIHGAPGEVRRAGGVDQALGRPEPQVHAAAARVGPGLGRGAGAGARPRPRSPCGRTG